LQLHVVSTIQKYSRHSLSIQVELGSEFKVHIN